MDSLPTVRDSLVSAGTRTAEGVRDEKVRPGYSAVTDTGTVRPSVPRPGATSDEPGLSSRTSGDSEPDGAEAPVLLKSELNREVQPVQSRAPNALASPSTPVVDLGGLVVDETLTPQGRTFYSDFFGAWRSPPTTGFYIIRVRERPMPGRGTLVQVFVNDDVTFQTRLQAQTTVDEAVLQAARQTYAYVRSGRGILQIY